MHPPKSTARRAAFTLIELLVVIAIISLLAAILFPVFGQARDRARGISCTSNLKQIYLGLRQYANDYDGKYWTSANALGSGFRMVDDQYSLPSIAAPYIKNNQVWYCPNEHLDLREAGAPGYWWTLASNPLSNPDYYEGNAVSATMPTIFVQDNYNYKATSPFEISGSPTQWGTGKKYCAHVGNSNFNTLYLDGHVKLWPFDLAKKTTYCGRS